MSFTGERQIVNLIGQFKLHLLALHKSILTVHAYAYDLENFAHWFEETHNQPMLVDDLTQTALDEYFSDRHFTETARRRLISASRAFARWLYELSIPVSFEHEIHPENDQSLSEEEVDRLLAVIERRAVNQRHSSPARNRALILLLLEGLPVSEVIELRVQNLVDSSLYIHPEGSPPRQVPIREITREAVLAWMEECQSENKGCKSGLLFPGQNGDPVDRRTIMRLLQRISKEAQVEASPRRLRQTCIQRLYQEGVPGQEIAHRLGNF